MEFQEESDNLPPIVRRRVRELEPGMVLARPVYSSEGCRLMQAGEPLDPGAVERLKRWKTGTVYIFDPDDSASKQSPFSRPS
jgi:hypothetical protein